jgi:hypothetical protein
MRARNSGVRCARCEGEKSRFQSNLMPV